MKIKILTNVFSLITFVFSLFFIAPLIVAIIYKEKSEIIIFLETIIFTLSISSIAFFLTRNSKGSVSLKDGSIIAALSWFLISLIGAIPFYISGVIPNYAKALFETASGLSTTGASVLENIEAVPKSILFWRSLTHFIGGMGIIVLTVALLPMLGIGGLNLMRAEATGLDVDRLTSKINNTALMLWFIYIAMTLVEILLLRIGGMNLFDAINHSFATIATGGYSTKNNSIEAYNNSDFIQWVIIIFMFLSGVNFVLYYKFIMGKFSFHKNTEFVTYLFITVFASFAVFLSLKNAKLYTNWHDAIKHATFQVVSILTTTGFSTADYEKWPNFAKAILFTLMFIGGSAGSTAGGIKVIRIVMFIKLSFHEIKYLIYPSGVFRFNFDDFPIKKSAIYSIAGFIFIYVTTLVIGTVFLSFYGYDILTSFSTVLTCMGNIGPGFNLAGPSHNYAFFPNEVLVFLSFIMIFGRLEIYTVLVMFHPLFWRR